MKYKEIIYKYFNFSTISLIQVGNKVKETIHISGKPRKVIAVLYLIFCVLYSCFSYFYNTGSILTILVALLAVILVFFKYKLIYKKLEYKVANLNIYQRELPSKLKPAHVRMLVNDGLVDETTVATTILDLIDNGYLKLKKDIQDIVETNNLFSKNVQITIYKTNKNTDNLLKYEKFLIDWFIDECGNGLEITNIELQKKLCNPKYNYFQYFQLLVIISFPINKFYKKINLKKLQVFYLICFIVGFMLNFFWLTILPFHLFGLFIIIYSVGCFLFTTPAYVLNQTGTDELNNWLGLKKYLIDFSNIKDKTVEMITLWNFYLTYSIALDINSKASEEIKNFFGNNILFISDTNPNNYEYAQRIFRENYFILELDKKNLEQEIISENKKYNL